MSRHIYFGGSFFPPHRAHSEMIEQALARDPEAILHLVPTKNNPLKNSPGSNIELIQTWIEDLAEELKFNFFQRIQLETLEMLSEKSPSYTVETLSELHEEKKWTLLLGSDTAQDFPRWREPEKILSLLESVWIVPRVKSFEAIDEKNFISTFTKLRKELVVEFLQPVAPISSTALRSETSSQILEEFLSPKVAAVWKRFLC